MKKLICSLLLAIMAAFFLTGCGRNETPEGEKIELNFINKSATKLVTRDYVLRSDEDDITALVEEIIYELGVVPEDLSYIPVMNQGFVVDSFEVKEGKLTLSLSSKYTELEPGVEVLTRAALVKTLTQLDGINYVMFQVNGVALMDALGNPVGVLSSDSFVDNQGTQINPMEETKLRLYFTDEEGTGLVGVTRTLTYNTNMSLEKLVIEQLILGPSPEVTEVFPTINPETKVLNVTVKDGICYVNFNSAFLTQPYSVSAEATIYSIVNSLSELTGVNKVQISIEGDSSVIYKETISLTTPFERNLDLVKEN
ncbi:MAG: GerMN domain-containing protein [Lachnospiraceae bacterium]|nr:GerMN domain-containing protein [Lachnospiraceae bacterium]